MMVMSKGTVVEMGAPVELMRDPSSMFSLMLSESSNEDQEEEEEKKTG